MAFEDLIATITEETDRASLAALAKKYPSLREFAEAGEKTQKLRPRLDSLKLQDFEPVLDEVEKWRTWRKDNWDEEHRMTKAQRVEKEAREAEQAAYVEAQAKIAELEGRTGTDMTPEEVRQVVQETLKASNVVNSEALEARITKAINKEGEVFKLVDDRSNGLAARFEDIYDKVTPTLLEHKEKFGETIKPKEIFDYMVKNNIADPEKAYTEMTAPKLAKLNEEAQKKAVEDAEKRGEEKGRRMAAQSKDGRGIPIDGKGSRRMGPLEKQIMDRAQAKAKAGEIDGKLGAGIISSRYTQQRAEKEAAAGNV